MSDQNDLFDDEPEKPAEGGKPAARQAGGAGGSGSGVTRRRFLVGAGAAAAAGAAVGTAATVGIVAVGGGGGSKSGGSTKTAAKSTGPSAAPATEAGAVPLGAPADQTITRAVVNLNVNGTDHWLDVAPNESLAEVLRRRLGLTGTKIGCDRSECSACAVHVDGVAQNSCSLLAIRESGKKIVTIEGLANGATLHPVQLAFMEQMGLQCGFCTPGQIMQAAALLQRNPKPDEAAIRRAMSGNLCKCAAYPNIIAAVQAAANNTKQG